MKRVKCDCEQGPTVIVVVLTCFIGLSISTTMVYRFTSVIMVMRCSKPQCFVVLHQQSIKLKVVLLPSD